MWYSFEYDDEINNCFDCPFFYDYIVCLIDKDETHSHSWVNESFTDDEDSKRPDWCPLEVE